MGNIIGCCDPHHFSQILIFIYAAWLFAVVSVTKLDHVVVALLVIGSGGNLPSATCDRKLLLLAPSCGAPATSISSRLMFLLKLMVCCLHLVKLLCGASLVWMRLFHCPHICQPGSTHGMFAQAELQRKDACHC